jgi:hypothetical protein
MRYLSAVVIIVVCAAPRVQAEDWSRTVNQWLQNSGLDSRQQNAIRNRIKQIENSRKKQDAQKRKESSKKSMQAIKEAYNKGKKAYQEKRYSAAYLHFQDVASCSLKAASKIAADAKAKVLEIEAMALGRLEQAKILVLQNQPLQASQLLQEIVDEYPYCDAASQARQRLQTLRSIPSVAASIRYREGKAQEDAEGYGAALAIYDEVMQRWPGELAALRARVAADSIRSDPEKMEIVKEAMEIEADRVCPTLINLAKSFIMNYEVEKGAENPDGETLRELRLQAAERLNKVIADFPNSVYAKQAQDLLTRLD